MAGIRGEHEGSTEERGLKVSATTGRDEEGRLICIALRLESTSPGGIKARDLSRLRLRQLLSRLDMLDALAPHEIGVKANPGSFRDLKGGFRHLQAGPGGLPDMFYENVAGQWATARSERRDPTAYMAQRFGVSPQTIRNWLRRARELGYLPASGREAK